MYYILYLDYKADFALELFLISTAIKKISKHFADIHLRAIISSNAPLESSLKMYKLIVSDISVNKKMQMCYRRNCEGFCQVYAFELS